MKSPSTPMLWSPITARWTGSHQPSTSRPAKSKSVISPLTSRTAPLSFAPGPTTTLRLISCFLVIMPHVTTSNPAVSGTLFHCLDARTKTLMTSGTWILPMTLLSKENLCSTPSTWSFPASWSRRWLFWCSTSRQTVARRWLSVSPSSWPWLCFYSLSQRLSHPHL